MTADEAAAVRLAKCGARQTWGWEPRLRERFGYSTPDDYYEALVAKMVFPGCQWLDVGCGHEIFPTNARLAAELAERCGFLMGIDPSDNIQRNPYLDDREQATIETSRTDRKFDLITLRMVAEHIVDPRASLSRLAGLTKPGGRVIVFTVARWSLTALAAWLIPFWLHHPIKRVLWRTEEEDTFPVAYRLNSRSALRRQFGGAGFREVDFRHLDDCRAFHRFKRVHHLELSLQAACRNLGCRYPDACLLGLYERR